MNRHVIGVTVRDRPGVLVRIASLIARRGFNIESLSVAQSEQPGLSRTTFVVVGDDPTVEQVQKQLKKLLDVIEVIDHSVAKYVDRELMLIKVRVDDPEERVEIRQVAQDFRARIVDVARSALIFEVTGDEGKIDAFIEQIRQALWASKVVAYAQGFDLIRTGGEEFGWNISVADCARIWRDGCINDLHISSLHRLRDPGIFMPSSQ